MKVEISEDQNTLTVDGIEYEAKLNNERPHKSSCLSCVFYDKGFCQIAMKKPVGVNASDLRRCEWPYRRDMRPIFWIEKEAKQVNSQDINFSDDENSLIIKDGFYKGEYEAKIDVNTCDDCFFSRDDSCSLGGMSLTRCAPKDRKDEQTIFWIKKEQKMKEVKPHVHAELIKQWADDVNQDVWYFDTESEKWTKWGNDSVMWLSSHQYAVGEMPTEPPVKMVKYPLGTIEFPEPIKKFDVFNEDYFFMSYRIDSAISVFHSTFTGVEIDNQRLRAGFVHPTREAAELHVKAFEEFLQNYQPK